MIIRKKKSGDSFDCPLILRIEKKKGISMWSKETKEEKERKKEQAFYEHYGAMVKSK